MYTNYTKLKYSQKYLKSRCIASDKKVYFATHILDTINSRYLPSGADINDLANILELMPQGIVPNYDHVKKRRLEDSLYVINLMQKCNVQAQKEYDLT